MNPDLAKQFGTTLYHQSLTPYTRKRLDDGKIAIVGLDTEYYNKGQGNVMVSWQLGFDGGKGAIFGPPLDTKRLYDEAMYALKALGYVEPLEHLFFVTYFVTAEAQFFYDDSWQVSEYKGKYSFSTKYGKINITVLDLAGWFPGLPLATAAETFGLKKIDYPIVEKMDEIAQGKVTVASLFDDPEFRTYAINDAIVTGEIWKRIRYMMLDDFDIDTLLTRTAPATSAAIYRKHYIKGSLTQPWTRLRRQAVASAWGGRTECFYRGVCEMAYAHDATSHHPSSAIAMGELPTAEDWYETVDINKFLDAKGGLCKVAFEFPIDEEYPCLPVFSDGSLIFPLIGISDCSSFECKLAFACGAKLTLIQAFAYDRGTDSLTRYLSMVKEERTQTEDKARREMLKLIMNGIVGKLFQKNLSPSLQALRDYAEKENVPLIVVMGMRGLELPNSASVGSSFFPEWYALILGYARANISRVLRDNHALMVSSDSVITESDNLALISDGIEYRLEKKGEYLAYRSKLYRIDDKHAHHAIHSRAVAVQVLKEFLDQSAVGYSVSHIIKLRESVKGVGIFGDNIEKPMTISLLYDYKRKLIKGQDGWTVPWIDKKEREDFLAAKETNA